MWPLYVIGHLYFSGKMVAPIIMDRPLILACVDI